MITFLNQIKLVRRLKKTDWVKTRQRGWIEFDTYKEYLDYGFDPIGLKYENYSSL